MESKKMIVVVGLGSLAKKLIIELYRELGQSITITVISRSESAESWCETMRLVYNKAITYICGDALNEDFLDEVFTNLNPYLILQTASLLSPFCLANHKLSDLGRKAGFGLMLPAQLAVARAVSRSAKNVCPEAKVVNCSFPDIVNPILSKLGYAPYCGIGNAGIVQYLIEKKLKINSNVVDLKVFAHHIHAISILKSYPIQGLENPKIYINGEHVEWKEVHCDYKAPFTGEEINMITTASSIDLLSALIDDSRVCHTSVSGPFGKLGGWPVSIKKGQMQIVENTISKEKEIDGFYRECTRFDGIESIQEDGSVIFSNIFKNHVKDFSSELCEPLKMDDINERYQLLESFITTGN